MRIGIDLGGTKTEGILLDSEGRERARLRRATPKGDADAILANVVSLVRELESEAGMPCTVGVGTPGSLSPKTGLLRGSNTTCLNGLPIDRMLGAALGREVRVANDANCFALSEATDGSARGARVVFGVIVGTGTGAGLVVEGRVLAGRHGIAGEWGHNPLPWPRGDELPGPPCYCGKRGCIETWLSGPGFAADHARSTGGCDAELDARAIAVRARQGDVAARASLDRYAERMARALATIIDVLDPDAIVLGGGMSNIDEMYPRVREHLPSWVFSDHVDVPISKALHGDSSGVRGAAWLWSEGS